MSIESDEAILAVRNLEAARAAAVANLNDADAKILELQLEVARLKAPPPSPLNYSFPAGPPPEGRSFFSYGDGEGPILPITGSAIYRVKGFNYRRETGIKHPTLSMIGPEPVGNFEYRIKIRPAPTWIRLPNKVVAAQFWSQSDAPPRLSLEFWGDRQRWVWLDAARVRVILMEVPLTTPMEATIQVRDGDASFAGKTGMSLSWGALVQPTFKWGAYYPAGREGQPGEAEVWVDSVERRAL